MPAAFEAAAAFDGARPAMTFKLGPQGLGYYGEEKGERAATKRSADGVLVEVKRQRQEIVLAEDMQPKVKRYSKLDAPTMKLTGHGGAVLSCAFSPDGQTLLTSSFDKTCFLWSVYGENEHLTTLRGHTNAVLEAHWSSDGARAYTCSADKTLACWDAGSGARIKKLGGQHSHCVNGCSVAKGGGGDDMLASASDDGWSKVWDMRAPKRSAQELQHPYPVTAVCWGAGAERLYTGSVDNLIRCYDARKAEAPLYTLGDHLEIVTGLRLSPDGDFVLSNAMDNTMRIYDVRPFVSGGDAARCQMLFQGTGCAQQSFDRQLLRGAWSPDGKLISCGSANRHTTVLERGTGAIRYRLPGHKGTITGVSFHPTEPILASCAGDKTIFLGEVDERWTAEK